MISNFYPKSMHGLIARDELLDEIDRFHSKISQCRSVGMSSQEIQSVLDEYLLYHCEYLKSIQVHKKNIDTRRDTDD